MIEGKAIQLHPLCCSGFNADFDGDTMAIHLPLSNEAIAEARDLMLATKNIITPKDGRPTITPTIDMLVGVYYLTTEKLGSLGEGIIFSTYAEVERAYLDGIVAFDAIVGISSNVYKAKGIEANKIIITTIGKILFNNILPNDFVFVNNGKKLFNLGAEDFLPEGVAIADYIKKSYVLKDSICKAELNKIIVQLFEKYDYNVVAKSADAIKEIGFKYATKSGISFSYYDLPVHIDGVKNELIAQALKDVKVYKNQYDDGLLTDDERYSRVVKR
jgi:DNA-directed RNA polymerase subunit beta'